MPLCGNPCPHCTTVGAQLIRHRPLVTVYFCETCLKEFHEPLDVVTAPRPNSRSPRPAVLVPQS